MSKFTLGDYEFRQNPDSMDLPQYYRSWSGVKTYTSYAFFSWGMHLAGATIRLRWETMLASMYDELLTLYRSDEQVVFDPKKEDGTTYNCEITNLKGVFYLIMNHENALRKSVELDLLIMSENLSE